MMGQPIHKLKWYVYVATLIVALLFVHTAIEADAEESPSASFYVSTTGSDGNPGTLAAPFATLERARDAVRALKAGTGLPSGGVTVYVRGGVYERTGSFELDDRDSGTVDRRVIYRPYAGEQVRLTGGVSVSSDLFQPVTDSVYLNRLPESARDQVKQINLATQGITDYGTYKPHGYLRDIDPAPLELFVGGQAMQLARWPNEGSVGVGTVIDGGSVPRNGDYSNRGGTFTYDYDRPERWTQASDMYVSGFFAYGYADDNIKVASIDTANKRITLANPHLYGIKTGETWRAYYAFNLLEEIDQPGEWYLDRQSGILYLYPPASFSGADVQLSMLEDPMVVMEDVSHVTIQGFIMEATRGMGIYIEGGEFNRIAGNTLRNMGTVAVSIGKGVPGPGHLVHDFTGTPQSRILGNIQGHIYLNTDWNRGGGNRHEIVSNDIYGTGAGGVFAGAGDRKTLTSSDVLITNNQIHEFNRRDKSYRPAIWLTGVGITASHNLIYNAPNMAIYIYGNNHKIEYNELHNVALAADDMGAIYMGRDPSEQGIVIRYNFFHHIGANWGQHGAPSIYLDDKTSGGHMYGNVFYKAGDIANFKLHGGHDNIIENNISVGIRYALQMHNTTNWVSELNSPFQRNRLLNAVNITQPPFSVQYPVASGYYDPSLMPVARPHDSNRFVRNVVYKGDPLYGVATLDNNLITGQNPGFEDVSTMDFTLKPNSVVYSQIPGFQPIPFGQMGLYTDQYRTSLTSPLGAFGLTAPNGSGTVDPHQKVVFSWQAAQGAALYKLVVSDTSDFSHIVYDDSVQGTSAEISGIFDYGKTYYWKVMAMPASKSLPVQRWNDGGAASFATEALTVPPGAPVLSMKSPFYDRMLMSWTLPRYAQSFSVYRSNQQGSGYTLIADSVTETVYTDMNPNPFEPNYYVVTAVNERGESVYSNELLAIGEQMTAFGDDFEGSWPVEWSIQESPGSNWLIDEEGTGHVLNFNGTAGVAKKDVLVGEAYSLEAKVKLNGPIGADPEAFVSLNAYAGEQTVYQLVYGQSGKLRLLKSGTGLLAETDVAWNAHEWHTWKLVAAGGKLEAYVDGVLRLTVTDSGPLTAGSIGLQASRANVAFDNVAVRVPKWNNVVPSPWTFQSFGKTNGYVSYANDTYTFRAGGENVWNITDEFSYVSRKVDSLDKKITVTATLQSLQDLAPNTMAGIMFREGEAANAANFYIRIKPNGEILTTWRAKKGEGSYYKAVPGVGFPVQLKVERQGSQFTSYYMKNGQWVLHHQMEIEMPDEFMAGLAVSALHPTDRAEAVFSGLTFSSVKAELLPPTIKQIIPYSGAVDLTWQAVPKATSYTIFYGTVSDQYTVQIQVGNVTNYRVTGLTDDIKYYFRIKAYSVDSESASQEKSITPTAALAVRNAMDRIEAESYNEMSGIQNKGTYIGSLDAGDWLRYNNVDFGVGAGASGFKTSIAVPEQYAGKRLEVRLDHLTGPLIGTLVVQATGSFTTFQEQSIGITLTNGIHNVYLVGKLGSGVGNVDWFTFTE